ncbi:phosphoglycerate mutase family domain containing protein [Acanthamoeba castellanii str. Neff]|uniref:Phosphoglycerate mutase family domain containing protein n=1 Tax=Acanthamoeba castellanii (strain ATCC 30010 / Neff) TaxID=1257118 RepID=L8H6U3_ACACF|nr:phosphoglycerate mutase family domain containing protein [Acanthamoeba castellanii str. Neff]ELR20171.1 phosphoglycerate mutase family domain containing protein [Acanthamoeba castellanii str. Neff]
MLKLVLVRHGQAETNLTHAVGRNNHVQLTDMGKEQARKLGQYWREHDVEFDHVFASEAVRATDTAKIFRGEWEGQSANHLFVGETLATYLADPHNFRAPGGESEKEVEERMHAFFDATVLPLYQRFVQEEEERRAKEGEIGHAEAHKPRELKVAIISHGCGLRCFLRRVLGTESKLFRFELSNTATSELTLRGTEWTVRTLNCTAHLH